jgi:FAD:protein FMN transferase
MASDSLVIKKLAGTTMGTSAWNVSVVVDQAVEVTAVQAAIQRRLDEINQQMSTYVSDSEVSRFNAFESTDWFSSSPDVVAVVERSVEISQLSRGAFDITVKPLVELWNFGNGRGAFQIPKPDAIAAILPNIGWETLETRQQPASLRKKNPKVQIDLSAIAPGYAVDQIGMELAKSKIDAWFVEIAGEVRAQGIKPNGEAWRVGIEKPLDDRRALDRAIALADQSLATSGDYRNFAIVDGRRYSHTISPQSGEPVAHGLCSVSVIAKDCITADAVATAMSVAGPDQVLGLAKDFGVEVMALERQANGFREIRSEHFPPSLNRVAPPAESFSKIRLIITTAAIFVLATLGLALGAIFRGRPLAGSCGGLGSSACSTCGHRDQCQNVSAEPDQSKAG